MSGRDRLGRGLGALLGEYMNEGVAPQPEDGGPTEVAVRGIAANPFQPRRSFKAEELTELAASIKANGLLQPILVRRTVSGRSYELVAGERRLRAVKQLGWVKIPAQVRDVDDRTLLVLALVENIQREELGPARGVAGISPASGKIRLHPAGNRGSGGEEPFDGRQHDAPRHAPAIGPAADGRGRAVDGSRARDPGGRRPHQGCGPGPRGSGRRLVGA